MTTQELYNKVLAEEVTQQKFLYEVRRDINLPFITSNNNFKDTVKILKNKGIISEKKLSTGKQEVEIFAKTIDMVNPYEYTRGMNYELDVVVDAMGNRISDNAGDSMHIEDLTKDDVLKAQKKVLKNLTKNPQFYQQLLIPQMEGETEHAIEVTAKSIEDLKKKAGKIIREHGEDYEAVSKVMGNVSPLEEEELEEQGIDSEHVVKFKLAGNNYYNEATFIGTIPVNQLRSRYREGNEIEDYDGNSKKIVDVQIETRPRAEINEMKKTGLAAEYQEAMKDYFNSYSRESEKEALDKMNRIARKLDLGSDISNIDIKDLEQVKENRSERNTNYITALGMYKNAKGTADEKMAREKLKKAAEDIGLDLPIFDKPIKETNYGTGIKKDEQIAAKKMANKRESIYEKYAEQYGVDVNELKDRLEAYKISQEEAIEVEDEDTAISVQKKSPDADVRIIEK
jgi:hypothetical protein